ncbi:MAG TPA: hypothetical protein VJN18_36155 [Polyangiaceae bacterium]|nr:hypothetical protein [Polyangiaceae bacterium]
MDRYVRQRVLSGVGDAGQAHIEGASYAVSSAGQAALVERRYLERAGAQHFSVAADAPSFGHASVFEHAAAREFAAGAWRALGQLRRALQRGT